MPYSYVEYNATGVATTFTVPFQFINRSHVTVTLDGDAQAFTWITDGSISISPAPVGLVKITRQTPKDPLVTWADGGSDTASDKNKANKQSLYLSQEISEQVVGVAGPAGPPGATQPISTVIAMSLIFG